MDASDLVDSRRRAALALLGLRASDQSWLLGQLPDADRDDVAALLAELERMNASATPAQLAASKGALALETAEPEPEPAWVPVAGDLPRPDADAAQRALSRAPAALVHRELRTESDTVVAIVCALRPWRWRDELLALLGPLRAADIGRLQREAVTPTPAMAQALVAALAARIDAGPRAAGFAAELRQAQAQGLASPGRWWARWRR